jgi:hypothetical protein
MKQNAIVALIGVCLLIVLFIGSPASVIAAEFKVPEFPKNKIMVLGTYHMANPGLDQFNLEADDVLVPSRQREIEELIETLAKFQPTKIAVESSWNNPRTIDAYAIYLADEAELTKNETQQIGFRLAKIMGHKSIWPVDFRMGLEGDLSTLGAEFGPIFESMDAFGKAAMAEMGQRLSAMTIGQFLTFLNTPHYIDANHFFYSAYLLKLGKDENYPGVNMVANWYKRNLLITHNLLRIADPGGGDRILVIFGQGHAKLLNRFLDDSPYFDRVDVLDYLPPMESD